MSTTRFDLLIKGLTDLRDSLNALVKSDAVAAICDTGGLNENIANYVKQTNKELQHDAALDILRNQQSIARLEIENLDSYINASHLLELLPATNDWLDTTTEADITNLVALKRIIIEIYTAVTDLQNLLSAINWGIPRNKQDLSQQQTADTLQAVEKKILLLQEQQNVAPTACTIVEETKVEVIKDQDESSDAEEKQENVSAFSGIAPMPLRELKQFIKNFSEFMDKISLAEVEEHCVATPLLVGPKLTDIIYALGLEKFRDALVKKADNYNKRIKEHNITNPSAPKALLDGGNDFLGLTEEILPYIYNKTNLEELNQLIIKLRDIQNLTEKYSMLAESGATYYFQVLLASCLSYKDNLDNIPNNYGELTKEIKAEDSTITTDITVENDTVKNALASIRETILTQNYELLYESLTNCIGPRIETYFQSLKKAINDHNAKDEITKRDLEKECEESMNEFRKQLAEKYKGVELFEYLKLKTAVMQYQTTDPYRGNFFMCQYLDMAIDVALDQLMLGKNHQEKLALYDQINQFRYETARQTILYREIRISEVHHHLNRTWKDYSEELNADVSNPKLNETEKQKAEIRKADATKLLECVKDTETKSVYTKTKDLYKFFNELNKAKNRTINQSALGDHRTSRWNQIAKISLFALGSLLSLGALLITRIISHKRKYHTWKFWQTTARKLATDSSEKATVKLKNVPDLADVGKLTPRFPRGGSAPAA